MSESQSESENAPVMESSSSSSSSSSEPTPPTQASVPAPTISVEDFSRVNQELIRLKTAHYEALQRERRAKLDLDQVRKANERNEKEVHKLTDLMKRSSSKQEYITLAKENSYLKSEMQQRDVQIEALRDNMKHMYAAQDELEKQVGSLQLQLSKANEAKQSEAGSTDTLHHAMMETSEMNSKLEDDIAKLGAENGTLQKTVEQLRSQLRGYEVSLASVREKLEALGTKSSHLAQDNNSSAESDVPVAMEIQEILGMMDALRGEQKTEGASASPSSSENPSSEDATSGDVSDVSKTSSIPSDAYVESLQNQIELWREKCKRKQERILELEGGFEQKMAELKKIHSDDLSYKENEVANLRKLAMKQLDGEKNYKDLYEEVVEKERALSKVLEETTRRNSQLAEENDNLSTLCKSLEKSMQENEIAKSDSEILQKRLISKEEEHQNELASLSDLLRGANETVSNLEKKLAAAKEEHDRLNGLHADAVDNLSALEKLAESRRTIIDTISLEKDEMAANYVKFQNASQMEIANIQSKLAEAEAHVQGKQEELDGVVKQLAEANAKIDNYYLQIQELNVAVVELKSAKSELEALKESLQTTCEEQSRKIAELEGDLEQRVAEAQILKKQQSQNVRDIKKQLAQEAKLRERLETELQNANSASSSPSKSPMKRGTDDLSSSRASLNTDVEMMDDLEELVAKVTRLQQDHFNYTEKIRVLEQNIGILQMDNEAKTKIIQDLLVENEKDAFNSKASSSSSSSSSPSSFSPQKLTDMIKKKTMIGANGNSQLEEANRKLQHAVEETMSKNRRLEETITSLRTELAQTKKSLRSFEVGRGDNAAARVPMPVAANHTSSSASE